MLNFQRTLKRSVSFSGVGVHSGSVISVEIRPASANTGFVFQRTDLPNKPYIKADVNSVFDTTLATRIGSLEASVSTIEHLMAAFFGFGIDNAIISINNSEMPILDGSSVPFLTLFDEVGIEVLKEPRKVVVIEKVIEVVDEKNPSRFIRVEPSKKPLISYVIDFAGAAAIGRQSISMNYTAKAFCEEFSFARTFCLKEDIDYMHSRGLAKGGSMENAIVVSKTEGVMNRQGLRNDQEFVKHKTLDCIGDLHMLGMPILGHVIAHKAGHDLHNKLARAILAEVSCRSIFVPSAKEAARLKALLSFPKSLSEIERNLIGLAIG
ncbi:UDP-3-O-acyl-N-acetylglucosamine deacetylase [Fluviispira multicolorata]|uniref:UDP-3-O-acyl-N-acetylglucosamine deacetylase n=1 Tax=Fluviispira multicolorata TaxID=2654512 RepID=A0A833N4M7_9BACT|nr:UDP-3-O-acyl-N-acetylglucosamine deacetylase [Fluviispira multicolorata]KAB8030966.1 UDP-3-O-[3-hydroxymyristoyl] N-acetylglucosamine deacetylase [Fluviispira multicolorata]